MTYEIESFKGVGALRFGMSPEQVHAILGSPRFSRQDPGHLREVYIGSPAMTFTGTDDDLKLVEIGFVKHADEVVYRGANLFLTQPGILRQRRFQVYAQCAELDRRRDTLQAPDRQSVRRSGGPPCRRHGRRPHRNWRHRTPWRLG